MLFGQAKLFHKVLSIPEQPFVIHRAALPVSDCPHADGESPACGRDGRAAADWHRLGERAGHDTRHYSPRTLPKPNGMNLNVEITIVYEHRHDILHVLIDSLGLLA